MFLLGYDIGSSSVKASLVDAYSGKCVASTFYPKHEAEILAPQTGWAEQQPAMWWENLKLATADVLCSSRVNKDDIKALEPGYYEIQSSFGKGGTKPLLRGKPKDMKKLDVPGPGKYDNDKAKMSTLKKDPSTCLGFGNRTDITEKERKKDVPGFKYEYGTDFDVSNKSKIKANTFQKSERMTKIKNNNPGPGAYYLPCSFGVVPDYQGVDSKYRKV